MVMSIASKINSVTRHPADGQRVLPNVTVLLRSMAVAHQAVARNYLVGLPAAGSLAHEVQQCRYGRDDRAGRGYQQAPVGVSGVTSERHSFCSKKISKSASIRLRQLVKTWKKIKITQVSQTITSSNV